MGVAVQRRRGGAYVQYGTACYQQLTATRASVRFPASRLLPRESGFMYIAVEAFLCVFLSAPVFLRFFWFCAA